MSFVAIVRHNHCYRCRKPSDALWTVESVTGEPIRIHPKPPDLHLGICRDCLRVDAWTTLEATRVLPESPRRVEP